VDDQLRYLRTDVEANVDLPDFDRVAARGARIRRRRTIAVSATAAVVVALVLVGATRPFNSSQSVQPVHQPAPSIDNEGARVVLADPAAYVDTDASRVDGRGNVLSVVREDLSGSCPGTGASTAIRWTGSHGGTHAWLELPRPVLALADGFVIGAVGPDCDTTGATDARAYLVDSSGVPRPITWAAGAERICAEHPQDPRCRYDLGGRRGSVVPGSHPPAGAVLLQRAVEGTMWARSADSRRIFWSTDGRDWRSRTTSLPKGAIVSASAAGERAVLAGDTSVEYTSDGGRSWHKRDLTSALSSIKIVDVDWTVTRNGYLLGVTQIVGRGDVLFRSTSPSWSHFAETGVHTSFGLVRPSVEGRAVYVPDDKGWLLSTDDGASWRRTPPLP
jgi:hypothetical protein